MLLRIVAILVGLLALAFYGFSIVDMYWTLTGNEDYLVDYSPEMIAWVQGFPLWRKVIWGASIGFGVLGALLLFLRSVFAGHLLFLAWLLMLGGFVGHDIIMANGLENYGRLGIIASVILIVVALVFSIAGHTLAKRSAPPA
jgi:hypothetical protein